jgi:hypothetical protein
MIVDESDPLFPNVGSPICGDTEMTQLTEIQKTNEELAERINREALANPQSPYAGKYVGIANCQVVAVADTLSAMLRLLRSAEPDPTRTFYIEASRNYDVVAEIWETR